MITHKDSHSLALYYRLKTDKHGKLYIILTKLELQQIEASHASHMEIFYFLFLTSIRDFGTYRICVSFTQNAYSDVL